MSIYITGDTHGDIDWSKLNTKRFPEQKNMTKEDVVIIAGDFGGVWDGEGSDCYIQKFYNSKPFTTAFVDGNHENHWMLDAYPIESWNGGKIHRISDSIVHLMRGEVYTIQGKTLFCMGGATSIDKNRRAYGISWWPEEMPSKAEYDNALKNLERHDFSVDYVITHDCPTSILEQLYSETWPDELNEFLDILYYEYSICFSHWYFGHHHIDRQITDRYSALYQKIIRIL